MKAKSTLLQEGTRALSGPGPDPMGQVGTPTCPDGSLPWSEAAGHGGWSAKMFLHQMMSNSRLFWNVSDTEQYLSELTLRHLQGRVGRGILLSEVLKAPGQASPKSYSLPKTVVGLFRRALARNKSFRVLLRTEHDTTVVIVTFGTGDYESWTLKSERPLPAFLLAGFLDYLKGVLPGCAETP